MCNSLPHICFIACDSGPATHFAIFAMNLLTEGNLHIDIYASGPALAKFQDLRLPYEIRLFEFTLNELDNEEEQSLAADLLHSCMMQGAQTIIIDIANKFDTKLQEVFNKLDVTSRQVRFWCYYDNPEQYVPGGYSIRSGETIKLSRNILFANMNLVETNSNVFSVPYATIDLSGKSIQGVGYYPIDVAEKLYQRREIERETLRAKYGWSHFKYLFVYFGGNNEAYYEKAFPMFLNCLSHVDKKILQDIVFLIHQHPAAKKQNRDGLLFKQWLSKNSHVQAALSMLTSSDEAQVIAHGVLYYQTSMGPQFALIGLPILQVGHEIYQDVLVKHGLCETATNTNELIDGLQVLMEKSHSSTPVKQKQLIYDAIGYKSEWLQNLRVAILGSE